MLRTIPPILLLLLLFVSCASPELDNRLATIEQMMSEQPDSALSLLEEIDTRRINNHRQRAWHALLYSQALDKNYIDSTNDSIINIAVEYYEKHGNDAEHLFLAYYYKARIYENSGNQLAAINMLTQAETLINLFDNNRAKGLMYIRIGRLFYLSHDNQKCIDAYKKSLFYFERIEDKRLIYSAKRHLATTYINTKDWDNAKELLAEATKWYYDNNKIPLCKECLEYLCDIYEHTNDLNSLKHLIESEYFTACYGNTPPHITQAYIYASQGNTDKANEYIDNAWKETRTFQDSINLQYKEQRIRLLQQDYYAAYKGLHKILFTQDSITRITLQQPLVTIQRDFYQKQTELQKLQLKHNIYIYTTIIIFILLLFLFTALFVRQYILSQKAEIRNYIDQVEKLIQISSHQETAIDDMKTQIKLLFKEHLVTIEVLYKSYCDAENSKSNKDYIYKTIKKHFAQMRENQDFYAQFEEIINMYMDNIMIMARTELSSLSEDDFRLLCYLYAGLPAKEISLLTNYSTNNIYVKKSRIKQLIQGLPQEKAKILCNDL